MNPINHVAIIMDGNGRWGIKHKKSRNAGHRAGLDTVETTIRECLKNKIKYLYCIRAHLGHRNWYYSKVEGPFKNSTIY
jgi:undecaprenyl diphosphate synthase